MSLQLKQSQLCSLLQQLEPGCASGQMAGLGFGNLGLSLPPGALQKPSLNFRWDSNPSVVQERKGGGGVLHVDLFVSHLARVVEAMCL